MRAAVLRRPGVEGLDISAGVRTAQVTGELVRVRVRAAGVCHSDLSAVTGRLNLALPVVIGHEAAGEVVEVGDEVERVRVGERVMVSWIPQCGTCAMCTVGQPELCTYAQGARYRQERFLLDGEPVAAQAGCGAFAEEILVTEHNLVVLPDGVQYEVGALISCGVTTGLGAVFNTACLRPGSSAVVIGCGGVGASIVQAARIAGAKDLTVVDPSEVKRRLATRLGADHAVAPEELAEHIATVRAGEGFDYAFEAVGMTETIRAAYDATRRGGSTIVVGVGAADADVRFSARELYASGRKLVGSVFGSSDISRDFARNIELWRSGALDLESLVSDRISLDELPRAIDKLAGGSALRSVVVFDE